MAGDNKSKKTKKNPTPDANTRASAASTAAKSAKSAKPAANSDSSDDEDDHRGLKELLAEHSEEISRRILGEIDDRIAAAVVKATADLGQVVTEQRDSIIKLEETATIQTEKIKELKSALNEKEKRISNLEQSLTSATESCKGLRGLIHSLSARNEQYSRRDCLRISGLKYIDKETDEALKRRVIGSLIDLEVGIDHSDIFRLHHSSKPYPINKHKKHVNFSNDNDHQLPIDEDDVTMTAEVIIRFTNWAARSNVYDLHFKKNLGIRVNLDLTQYRRATLQDSREFLKTNNLKGYVYANSQCNLIVRDASKDQNAQNGKRKFEHFEEFKQFASGLKIDSQFHKRRPHRE